MNSSFAELAATTNFSFLRGASHPEELVRRAAELNYRALAITDWNSMAGVVRAHVAAKECGLQLIVGCRLEMAYEAELPEEADRFATLHILAYPTSRAAYGNLCRLLSIGKRRTEKGRCFITLNDLLAHQSGLLLALIPPSLTITDTAISNAKDVNFSAVCSALKDNASERDTLSIALVRNYGINNTNQIFSTIQIARQHSIPLLATNDVYYHIPERRMLQDVLTCIRHCCKVSDAGLRLFPNGERYLKEPREMCRLFTELPEGVTRGFEIAERAKFSLDELRYEYPNEICPNDMSPLAYLTNLTWAGAQQRYPEGVPDKVTRLLTEELKLIHELQYEKYFLTCHDIVQFARARDILCQGRGAAANSAVCYCLGITAVDPARIDLLFARFVSRERSEPPDIDIDFEHERREEVIQYIYQKYGRDRAGLTATVITYRHRSAIRDVGKAMGLPLEVVDGMAKSIRRWSEHGLEYGEITALGLDPDAPQVKHTLKLANEILGFPRHLSQHVGGFIICERPLCETVPILNAAMPERTNIEWDKDDIEALGMLKIDILGLGMLTCIRKAMALVSARPERVGMPPLELHTIPPEDPAVYEMVSRSDTVGVFQIESRAQMSMLPRLRPKCFYDLVIEVAIVRPGPIQGKMVHPYLRRRNGEELPYYPDARVKEILGKTLGVPLFQEQAMRLAIVLANFSPGEAEMLRRAMAAWKRDKGKMASFQARIMRGMQANGYSAEFAQSCIDQMKGFSEYGFPESHAASFALLVYASAWLKCHYPAEFAAALINSQPMGFYQPAQIVSDAQKHGVEVLGVDVNESDWDCTVRYLCRGRWQSALSVATCRDTEMGRPFAVGPSGPTDRVDYHQPLQLGFRLVKSLHRSQADLIIAARAQGGPFKSILDLWNRARQSNNERLRRATLLTLARADAFRSLGLDRHRATWEIRALPPEPLPLDHFTQLYRQVPLPAVPLQLDMFEDYAATGLSLKAHPIGLIRQALAKRFVRSAAELRGPYPTPNTRQVTVAGIVLVRQRPHTAKGFTFLTIEDETGMINLVLRPHVYEQHRRIASRSTTLLAHGILERTQEVIYVNVQSLESLDAEVRQVKLESRDFH